MLNVNVNKMSITGNCCETFTVKINAETYGTTKYILQKMALKYHVKEVSENLNVVQRLPYTNLYRLIGFLKLKVYSMNK